MKALIPIVCTLLICASAIYINYVNKESNKYIYEHTNTGDSGLLLRIDRSSNETKVWYGNRGWINYEDRNK